MRDAATHNTMRWSLTTKGATLLAYGEILLDITHVADGEKRLTWHGGTYAMRQTGFWARRTLIERNGSVALFARHAFLGSSLSITLADGERLTGAWSNAPLAKLYLRNAHDQEVLSLRLVAEGAPRAETTLADGMPMNERTVLLVVLAYSLFEGVMRENTGTDPLLLAGERAHGPGQCMRS